MRKIIKTAQSLVKGLILNVKSNSKEDTYSCDYINEIQDNIVSDSVPIDSIIEYNGTDVPKGWEKYDDDIQPQGYVLYDNPTGSSEDITLNDLALNYDYIEIFGFESKTSTGNIYCKIPVNKNTINQYFSISGNASMAGINQFISYSNHYILNNILDSEISKIEQNPYNASVDINFNRFTVQDPTWDDTKIINITRVVGYKTNLTMPIEDTRKDVYSTDEIKTNKIWIDGRPIYRKVIDFGYLPSANASKEVPTGIDTTKVLITDFYGTAVNDIGSVMKFNDVPSTNMFCRLTLGVNQVIINANYDRSAFYGYITIEYVKNKNVTTASLIDNPVLVQKDKEVVINEEN